MHIATTHAPEQATPEVNEREARQELGSPTS